MPRPKRARREPPVAPSTTASNEETVRRRGRPRKSTAPSLTDETVLGAARRKRDAALDDLVKHDATSSVVGEGGRAATATPLRRGHVSGLDLADDEVFGALDDDFADDSLLSSTEAGHRRRPRSRQSSIVGPNDPPIRPSSRGPNTPGIGASLNIGLFRRRVREPSILGTSRKPLPARDGEEASDKSSDVEADQRPTPSLSRSRKRKSGDDGDDDDGRENVAQESSSSSLSDVVIDSDSDLSVLASPSLTAPGLPSAARPVTPINTNDDEIAAPPASSGSESGADAWPDIHVLAKRRRRPSTMMLQPFQTGHQSDDNMSSPPSLTHSPNYKHAPTSTRRGRRRRRRASSPPKLTTAHLTNLLPKRRQRKRARHSSPSGSEAELDATDLTPEQDELAYLDVRSGRSRRPQRRNRAASSSGHAADGAVEGSVLKPTGQTVGSTRQPKAANEKRSHLRRSSDKENEVVDDDDDDENDDQGEEEESALVPLPDDTFDSTPDAPQRPADELKKAARKFKEVDKWELDFEEVTESPSSQDAR
ncbi:hypothetical protein CP533_0772 [Ophiocordyceps camponoti-saundersi (nom. inval.)]|nr:hypothetical protein CP533_0772 [Ophiocordyceps camponoti-saundersi (nom. inval.)]